MNSNKKQGLYEISVSAVKVLLLGLLALMAFVFVYYGIINRGKVIESEPVRFVENWKMVEEEDSKQIVSSVLPSDLKSNEYIYFDTRNDVSVYIGGELRKDYKEKRDINIPGGSFRRFLMEVPVSEADSGAEITIVRESVRYYDKEIPEVFFGTRSGAMNHLFGKYGLTFILSVIVLIFALVSFIVSIVLRLLYKQRIEMLFGALGIFTIAAWVITDSYLFPFVFGVYHVNGLLSFMLCLMIPLGLVVYLSAIQRGRYKRFMIFLMLLSTVNALVWPVLHYTGLISFDNLVDVANAVLVILAVLGIAILVVDAVNKKTESYRYTFIGFMGFLIGCLIELINTIFSIRIITESVPMVIGLGFLLIFIVVQQVNDLRKISKEKQQALDVSEAKTRFLASMSHEIRTPINSILGMNEMILRENSDKNIEEYSRNIKTSGKMLLMLVNDVLDFTKIESGKMEVNEADFLMSDMLYDVVSIIKERADEKALELKTEITDEVPDELISDEFRIRQILVNLMNNAVKYTEEGKVTLKVGGSYTEDGYLLSLAVKDTGKGIKEEDKTHLFEAFSRADIKSNINIEGTGLGLAIVKRIVDSMNGELGVESEYGVGSEFWVKLPVKYKTKEQLRDDFMERRVDYTAENSNSGFTAPDAKILAVDDNRSNLNIVKLFLKRNSIIPELCSSGEKAIKLCKDKTYDLILLDHMMPQPDGIEVLHHLRNDSDSLNKETKVVVLTANAVAGSRQMYLDEGFDDYLTKPLDSEILEETVKTMLPEDKVICDDRSIVAEVNKEAVKVDVEVDVEASGDKGLRAVEGLDYEMALSYCGGEEDLLLEIIGDIVNESSEISERMRKSLETGDIDAYRIDAHSIKGSMATIGLKDFSERARKHEFAARDNDMDFINADAESFIEDYTLLCDKLSNTN